VQLGQADGALALLDVAEDAAGADRGEVLIITDQSDTRTAIGGELHGGVEGEVDVISRLCDRLFDHSRHRRISDRPQGRHRLHRGERQVRN